MFHKTQIIKKMLFPLILPQLICVCILQDVLSCVRNTHQVKTFRLCRC